MVCKLINTPCLKSSILVITLFFVFLTRLLPTGYVVAEEEALKLQFKFREGMLHTYKGHFELVWLGPEGETTAKPENKCDFRLILKQLIIKVRDDGVAEIGEQLLIHNPVPASLGDILGGEAIVPKSIERWMLVRENGVVIESRKSDSAVLELLPLGGDANLGVLPLILSDEPVKVGDTWTIPDAWALSSGKKPGGEGGEVQYEFQDFMDLGKRAGARIATILSESNKGTQSVLFYPDFGKIGELDGVRAIQWNDGELKCRLELYRVATRTRASKRTIIEDAEAMNLGSFYDIRNLIEPFRVQGDSEAAPTGGKQKGPQPEPTDQRFKLQFKLTEGDKFVYHYESTHVLRDAEKQLALNFGLAGREYTAVTHVTTTMVVTRDYGNGDFEITRLENPQLVKAILDGRKAPRAHIMEKIGLAGWESLAQVVCFKMNDNGRIVDYPGGGWYENGGPCANINYGIIPGYLPDKPVAVGESWEQTVKLQNRVYRDCKIRWTLVGIGAVLGYNCVKIKAVLEPINTPILKGGEQTIWFAYDEGLLVKIIGDSSDVLSDGTKGRDTMSALLISRERLSRDRLIRAKDGLDFIRAAQYYIRRNRLYDARSFYQIFLERCRQNPWSYGALALQKRVQGLIELREERGENVSPPIVEFKKVPHTLYEQGDKARAFEKYQEFLKRFADGSHTDKTYYDMARALYDEKNYGEAVPHYVEFLKRSNDAKYVEQARQELFCKALPHTAALLDLSDVAIAIEAFRDSESEWVRDMAELALIHTGMEATMKPSGKYDVFLKWWRETVGDIGRPPGMVLTPAGEFVMGSPENKETLLQHKVQISKAFYISKFEVTQQQYEAVMGKSPSYFKAPSHPVEHVNWNDAVAFCRKLSEKGGREYRLPTEAEWEYACRAGSQTRFCYGDDDKQIGDYAWGCGNSGSKTHPVGQKKPNASGLYDMHGNVWEWCADWHDRNYYATSPERDPKGPASGKVRVVRGGSWYDLSGLLCSSFRGHFYSAYRFNRLGFRYVASVAP